MLLLKVDLAGYTVTRHWLPIAIGKTGKLPAPRPGLALPEVTHIIVGDSGRPGQTAAASRADLGQAYGHFLVDDTEIIEPVPAVTSRLGRIEQAYYLDPALQQPELAAKAIFVTLCYGGGMERDGAYERWVGFVAALRQRFKLKPDAVKAVSRVGPGRDDPAPALRWAGKTIDEYLAAVRHRQTVAQGDETGVPAGAPEHVR
jgi:hypothetical protein